MGIAGVHVCVIVAGKSPRGKAGKAAPSRVCASEKEIERMKGHAPSRESAAGPARPNGSQSESQLRHG